jgi:hypothetical protein
MGNNEREYEERRERERAKEKSRHEAYERERSDFAYDAWMSGGDYDRAWDLFEYEHRGG